MPKGLTGNQLKLIAMVAMTIDHVGMLLFPQLLEHQTQQAPALGL